MKGVEEVVQKKKAEGDWVLCQSHPSGTAAPNTAQALHAKWHKPYFLPHDRVMSLTDYNGPLMNSKSQAGAYALHYHSLTPDLPAE